MEQKKTEDALKCEIALAAGLSLIGQFVADAMPDDLLEMQEVKIALQYMVKTAKCVSAMVDEKKEEA